MQRLSGEWLIRWKEIEEFIGLKREAIKRLDFPLRKAGRVVIADKRELMRHMESWPLLKDKSQEDNKKMATGISEAEE